MELSFFVFQTAPNYTQVTRYPKHAAGPCLSVARGVSGGPGAVALRRDGITRHYFSFRSHLAHPSVQVVPRTDPFRILLSCFFCVSYKMLLGITRCCIYTILHHGKLHHSRCSRAHHCGLFTDKALYIAAKQSYSHDLCPTKCLNLKSFSKLTAASSCIWTANHPHSETYSKTIRPQTSLNSNLSSSAFGMLHPNGKEWAKMHTCRTMPICSTWNQGTCPNISVQLGHIQQRYSWPGSALYPQAV